MSKLTDKLRFLSGGLAGAYQDAANKIDRLEAELAKAVRERDAAKDEIKGLKDDIDSLQDEIKGLSDDR